MKQFVLRPHDPSPTRVEREPLPASAGPYASFREAEAAARGFVAMGASVVWLLLEMGSYHFRDTIYIGSFVPIPGSDGVEFYFSDGEEVLIGG